MIEIVVTLAIIGILSVSMYTLIANIGTLYSSSNTLSIAASNADAILEFVSNEVRYSTGVEITDQNTAKAYIFTAEDTTKVICLNQLEAPNKVYERALSGNLDVPGFYRENTLRYALVFTFKSETIMDIRVNIYNRKGDLIITQRTTAALLNPGAVITAATGTGSAVIIK